MAGMETAAERVAKAIEEKERVIVYADYDADGLTSAALLVHFFRALGREVETYIPHRFKEGYGLNEPALLGLAAMGPGLLLAVDTGTSNVAEVAAASRAGLEVIISDHHHPSSSLPPAKAILNPVLPGCGYPDKDLAGVGVTFKLVAAVRRKLLRRGFAPESLPNLRQHLDLVALGTVADVVPLSGENRVLVRHGLLELSRTRKPGLQALLRVAGVDAQEGVNPGQVGFQLGPRLNAAGRLGDARDGLSLLIEEDPLRAAGLAERLDGANRERQRIQEDLYQEVRERVGRDLFLREGPIVLAETDWHTGVLGIVAAKVVEEYHRPAILIGLQGKVGKGSGRSIRALHLYQALARCADLLEQFGGHEYAAGLVIRRERVGDFAERFRRIAAEQLTPEDYVPRLEVEAVVALSELTPQAVEAIQGLAPFGPGNPRPLLLLEAAEVLGPVRSVGREGQHLKFEVRQGREVAEAIGFGMGLEGGARAFRGNQDFGQDPEALNRPGQRVDLVFTPELDRWNDRVKLQLNLRDLRICS
jgi:single-stranded-DNA-specific exonuclease